MGDQLKENAGGINKQLDPLLVFVNYHNRKIACFMSDISPHKLQQFMSWPFYRVVSKYMTHIAR